MWGALVGAGLGALGGAMKKKPQAFDPGKFGLEGLYGDAGQQQALAGGFMDPLKSLAQQQPGLSQGEMTQLTGAGRKHINQQLSTGLARLGEQSLASGMGGRGGALGANTAALHRGALDATRGLESDTMNTALQMRAADKDRQINAANTGLGHLNKDRVLQAQLAKLQFFGDRGQGGQLQRSQFSRTGNIIGGALSGLGGFGFG